MEGNFSSLKISCPQMGYHISLHPLTHLNLMPLQKDDIVTLLKLAELFYIMQTYPQPSGPLHSKLPHT